MKLHRLFFVVVAFLFLVVVFEVGYYFFRLPQLNSNINPNPLSSITPTVALSRDQAINKRVDEIDKALRTSPSYSQISYLANIIALNYTENVLSEMRLSSTVQGKVQEISIGPGSYNPGLSYVVKMKILLNSGKTSDVFYDSKEVGVLTIRKTVNGTETKKIKLKDISVGDKLSIHEEYDLKASRLISAELDILN